MGLESGTYLNDLVVTNPPGTDVRSEGDDHIRLIKTVLQNTFPGMAGRSWRSQTKGSGYTVVANDNMTLLNCTAPLTLALTAAATLGNGHLFMAFANGGAVVIDPSGAEQINSAATITLPGGAVALILCNGTTFLAFTFYLTDIGIVAIKDSLFVLQDNADITKQAQFQLSGIATGQTRTMTVPDADITLGNWSTGDVKLTFKAAADAGWVMMNDGSIGNAASGATTRANADTVALFTLLWNNIIDTWAPVSGGRGANAAADYAANKTLTLPKELGRAICVAGAGSGLTSRALGEKLGEETHLLTIAEMPSHTHPLNLPGFSGGQTPNLDTNGGAGANYTSGATGGGGAHNVMQPSSFMNVMVKL